ncbi:MAG: glycosyltransferase family 9 protein [Planctomycetota bacterium]
MNTGLHIAVPVLAGMGNGLMAQPMVRSLARGFPGSTVTVYARNASIAAVFERVREVAGVRIYGNEARQFFRLVRDLRAARADLCVIPYPSNRWQYSLLAGLSRAKRVVLHGYEVGRFRALHGLAKDRVAAVPDGHEVEQNLNLVRYLQGDPSLQARPPEMRPGLQEMDVARVQLQALGLDPERTVAVHAGSGKTVFAMSKRWPAAKFVEVMRHLRDLDLQPVLLEGPEDAGVADRFAGETVPVLPLLGPLHEAAAVLAICRLYIGSDSGLAHLAAAVGTPPVTLFGPARPSEVSPWGFRELVVRTPASCAPCFRYPQQSTTPRVKCGRPYCVDQIEVVEVMDAVRRGLTR